MAAQRLAEEIRCDIDFNDDSCSAQTHLEMYPRLKDKLDVKALLCCSQPDQRIFDRKKVQDTRLGQRLSLLSCVCLPQSGSLCTVVPRLYLGIGLRVLRKVVRVLGSLCSWNILRTYDR